MQPIEDNNVVSAIIDSETGKPLANSQIELPNITDPQKLGSAITYFRRYTLKSLLAIAEGDDDGNLAAKPEPQKDPTKDEVVVMIGNVKTKAKLKELGAWVKYHQLEDIANTKFQTLKS